MSVDGIQQVNGDSGWLAATATVVVVVVVAVVVVGSLPKDLSVFIFGFSFVLLTCRDKPLSGC